MFGFFSRSPSPAPALPPDITMGLIGREHSGKSVLIDMTLRLLLHFVFSSGLSFQGVNPRRLAAFLRRSRENDIILTQPQGFPSTVDPQDIHFFLRDGMKTQAIVKITDPIGQMLTHTTEGSHSVLQTHYESYMSSLSQSDILWVLLPCLPEKFDGEDRRRFLDDVCLGSAYLREALSRRTSERPVVVAVILTRIDSRYPDARQARQHLTREIMPCLVKHFRPLFADSCVGAAGIWPVSALGFSTTVESASVTGDDHWLSSGESEWILKAGQCPRPFNVLPLAIWSVLSALRNRLEDDIPNPAQARWICQLLDDDLRRMAGWSVILKC